jgi:hypothetical protein
MSVTAEEAVMEHAQEIQQEYVAPAGEVVGTLSELTLGKPGRNADMLAGGDPGVPGSSFPSTSF